MRKFLLFAFLLLGSSWQYASAQSWDVGGFVGSSGYMGDINPTRPYKFTDLAVGAQVKRNFDGYWSAKLNLMHGKIQGDDALSPNEQQRDRNLSFYSAITEATAQVEFNFFKYQASVFRKYSPYLFTGVGGVMFNPKAEFQGSERTLRDLKTEGQEHKYDPIAITVPYGAGIKYNITGNWNLIGEIGYRTVFTDYLDDVSQRYPGPNFSTDPVAQALSDPSIGRIGAPGTQRGDFRKHDTYMFVGLSLTFTFVSDKCYY